MGDAVEDALAPKLDVLQAGGLERLLESGLLFAAELVLAPDGEAVARFELLCRFVHHLLRDGSLGAREEGAIGSVLGERRYGTLALDRGALPAAADVVGGRFEVVEAD